RAARFLAQREETCQMICLVQTGSQPTYIVGWNGVVRVPGRVVRGYRSSDLRRLPLELGIPGTHVTLQLGQLSDQVGDQIELAKLHGPLQADRGLSVQTEVFGDLLGELLESIDLILVA